MVGKECASWPFDLEIPGDHYGNCVTCWKKSERKLKTLAVESPHYFDFFRRMEDEYKHLKARNDNGERRFFRGHKTVDDIFEAAQQPFQLYTDKVVLNEEQDIGSGCGESCEIGADE